MIGLAHLGLAIGMFLLINWIGAHSVQFGYQHLSPFTDADESVLFNALYRVLAPNVCLVLAAALLYRIGADQVVTNIFMVTIYYFLVRWIFLLAVGRRLLSRWTRQFVVASASIALSWFVYNEFLQYRTTLLPASADLSTELWLLIILFVYHTLNQVSWPSLGAPDAARARYIEAQFRRFRSLYGDTVATNAGLKTVEALSYAVMIYESYNRPALYQWIERNLLFPIGKARSLGPMQVIVSRRVPDTISVGLGVKKLSVAFNARMRAVVDEHGDVALTSATEKGEVTDEAFSNLTYYVQWQVIDGTAADYNVRSDYGAQVRAIFDFLTSRHYPALLPKAIEVG